MSSTYYIADPIRALCRLAGIPFSDVAIAAGIPADKLKDRGLGISAPEIFALWTALRSLNDDTDLPITLARQAAKVQILPTLLAYLLSPTVAEGLRQLSVFKKATGPFSMEAGFSEGLFSVTVTSSERDVDFPPFFGLFEISYIVELVRLTTAHHVIPVSVHLPESLPAAEVYFGLSPKVGPIASVSFTTEDAARSLVSKNHGLLSQLQPTFEKAAKLHQPKPPVAEIIALHLKEAPSLSGISIATVARAMGQSKRAIQRSLRAEGTSFQAVVRHTRMELAMAHLVQGNDTVATIAVKLGYRDPNSFYRAFQRWTGLTPNQVRCGQSNSPI